MKMNKPEPLFFSLTLKFLTIYLPLQIGVSSNYIESMSDTLSIFKDFITKEKNESVTHFTFSECDTKFVRDFLEYLRINRNNKPTTRNTRLAELKTYLKYASEENIQFLSVYLEIKAIKQVKAKKEVRQVLTPEECNCIFNQPLNDKKGTRDRTFMILLYETACRLSEIINLMIPDIHIQKGKSYIIVNGKGKKQRAILISDKTVAHINNYNLAYHNSSSPNTNILFYTVIGGTIKPLSPRTPQLFIKKYATLARKQMPTIADPIYSHMFRRSKATTYYNNGIGIDTIGGILGHEQLNTTKKYALLSTTKIRKAMKTVDTTPSVKSLSEEEKLKIKVMDKFGIK